MATNKGVAPPEPGTDVFNLRAILGDLEYSELDPPEQGFGNYRFFGDGELQAFLDTGGSLEMAAYYSYMQLASSAAISAKSVRDMDLQVDTTKTPTELRLIAQMWRDQALANSADIFELFDTSIDDGYCEPELSARITWGGNCGV